MIPDGVKASRKASTSVPAIAIVLDGKVHLFYQTYGNGTKDTICHTTSDDGIHFDRTTDTPIFRPAGSWNCGRAIDAEARVIGDELFMYWATRDPTFKIQMLGVHSAPSEAISLRSFGSNDAPVLS